MKDLFDVRILPTKVKFRAVNVFRNDVSTQSKVLRSFEKGNNQKH